MFARLFIDHPRTVGEGYADHLRASLGTAGKLTAATAASTAILQLHAEITPRRFDQPTL